MQNVIIYKSKPRIGTKFYNITGRKMLKYFKYTLRLKVV